MDTLVVNLFGGPGVGKSTTAAGVFSLLKLNDIESEIITEYAKDLVWEERHKTFKDQQYIFAKQNHRLWRVNGKVDVIITDCPLMLSPIYGERYNSSSAEFDKNVEAVVDTFNNLNIILTRVKKYNQNGRNESEEEARDIDKTIKRTLADFGMPWQEAPGTFEGINVIANMILERFDKKSEFAFKYLP